MMRCTIGVDLGGTEIKAGIYDQGMNRVARFTRATDAKEGPTGIILRIVEIVEELRRWGNACAIGVGCPGPLSPSKGITYRPANLPGWDQVPLRDTVAKRAGLPTIIDNDANLAAYGEYRHDPSIRDLVLLTLGTGVGSGTIVDGRILHGHFENGSEWGHTIIDPGGLPCACGQRGCFEQYASASSVAKRATEAYTEACLDPPCTPLTSADVVAYAQRGDAIALRIWDEACRAIALTCINIQHIINPRRILLGGGMSAAGAYLMGRVKAHRDALKWHLHDDEPEITIAALGNEAGSFGAAAAAWLIAPDV